MTVQWIVICLAGDVFEDPIIGRRSAPDVVLGLQPVNGNHDVQMLQFRPAGGQSAGTRW